MIKKIKKNQKKNIYKIEKRQRSGKPLKTGCGLSFAQTPKNRLQYTHGTDVSHAYWGAQRFFARHAIKTHRHAAFSRRAVFLSWLRLRRGNSKKNGHDATRTSVRGLQTSSQFFYKRKATKSGSAPQFTLCAFCFFLLPISYLSLTLLLRLLYFVIIYIHTVI